MKQLIIATRNAHKVEEIQAMLPRDVACRGLKNLGEMPDAIEDADTFAGNALKKAAGTASWLLSPAGATALRSLGAGWIAVLADDSGLEVDALNGAPGIYSARFAALDTPGRVGNSPDGENNAKLIRLLSGVPVERRTARFRCALALVGISPVASSPQVFEGACEGRIQAEGAGSGGFGYDPLFIPDGETRSFAELGNEVKNRISHRAQALARLNAWLSDPQTFPHGA